jgi:DNA-nicking Smr family endonuclease
MATRRPRKTVPVQPEVSPEDLALFASEVAGDRPLDRETRERVRVHPVPRSSESKSPAVPSSSEPRGFPGPSQVEGSPGELESYVAPGVDRRELRKLKRGDYTPDLRIDLHGLMSAEAVARVKRVLDAGPGSRPRCLCVVHGRGLHSAGNVAVLKSRVRAVLRAHPAVLAFADAPRTDGGAGAVYVLLRK